MATPPYIIITPVRNEEEFLPRTIASLAQQTALPQRWALVDDGSTDSTAAIARVAAQQHDWIRCIKREDRGFRLSGSGVVEAFYEGFNHVAYEPWQFLAKLDGDLSFSPSYFADCFQHFDRDPTLGIGGGIISTLDGQTFVPEAPHDPPFHVRGAVKIYRRECWEAIGGLATGPCWDSIDELKANMLGWTTRTFADIPVHHHRPAGQAFGRWKDGVKGGRGNYATGYHPLFMVLKCLSRLPRKPVLLSAMALFYGFASSYVLGKPRLVDRELMRYIRKQQLRHIFGRPSLWTQSHSAHASGPPAMG